MRSASLCHAVTAVFIIASTVMAGTATQKTFTSQTLGKTMSYWLYLPADYATEVQSGKKYSVVYLLHMWLYKAEGWHQSDGNRVNPKLDQCIDSVDGIIGVAPQDDTPHASGTGTSWWIDSPNTSSWKYSTFLCEDLKGEIDATCSTYTDKGHTGICGASMGGFGTLHNLRVHDDIYYVGYAIVPCCDLQKNESQFGLYSAFPYPYTDAVWGPFDPMKNVSDFASKNIKLAFYTGNCSENCSGSPDVFLDECIAFHEALDDAGFEHTFANYADDSHEYPKPEKMVAILKYFKANLGTVDIALKPRLSAIGGHSLTPKYRQYLELKNSGNSLRSASCGVDGRTGRLRPAGQITLRVAD